jgi:hypothetical protein
MVVDLDNSQIVEALDLLDTRLKATPSLWRVSVKTILYGDDVLNNNNLMEKVRNYG